MSPYFTEGNLRTEKRGVSVSETWERWNNPQSSNDVEIVNGSIQLAEGPPDSGVSRWRYDDDSDASVAVDSWKTEDGEINGATYTTDSQVGTQALSFDGVDDYVGEFTDPAYAFTSNFTIGAWLKINSHETRNPIIAKGRTRTSETYKDYYIGVGGGNVFGDVSDGTDSATNPQGSSVSTGVYYHLALTYDGSTLVVYLDGSEDISVSVSVTVQDAHNLRIGGTDSAEGTDYFNGIIDDPRIYSKALSATEVSNWYSTGSIDG